MQKFHYKNLLSITLVLVMLFSSSISRVHALTAHQEDAIRSQALNMLANLTPEEKVGQLFLVTFEGTDVSPASAIASLISRYHVGGVVLRADNNNFVGPVGTIESASELIRQIQSIELRNNEVYVVHPQTQASILAHRIPLFIGMSQEGDGYPYDQILSGMTSLPSQMAIGATWKTEYAYQVGQILGQELTALGVNLFFGPSLDVLELNLTSQGGDLGLRSFGSDPFWVRELGKSYVQGLHAGSENQVVVIATHFPGQGSTDRSPDEEVATVRKSLEQLKQIELFPFFGVTGNSLNSDQQVDGMLVTHIRYQGFQGNIRATTRPVSLDQTALNLIMGLPEFVNWRKNGGLLVADNLGSEAIRKFFDPTGSTFDARQVAGNAFLAGNDLLYVDQFIATNDPDAVTTIIRTLEYFAQRYKSDIAFAQRVDEAVLRILIKKYTIYPDFSYENVISTAEDLQQMGKGQNITYSIADEAVTLISPAEEELSALLPRPPEQRERLLIFTDTQTTRQCFTCVEQSVFAVDGLKKAILKFYGAAAGGQVMDGRLFAYSFDDLSKVLRGEVNPELEDALRDAEWLIFAMRQPDVVNTENYLLTNVLRNRQDILRGKKVIVFAFGAPYYLDATDISKLTAYYGLFGKSEPFLEAAARVLFQELTPRGSLPVSVPGIGYDLITITQPDPDQFIDIFLDLPQSTPTTEPDQTLTPEATPVPIFTVGDILPLRTGVIVDHNGKPVPDNTIVRFIFTLISDIEVTQTLEAATTAGIARISYRIETPGVLDIRAVSEPAVNSTRIRLDVTGNQTGVITEIIPSPTVTETLTPTPTQIPPTLTPTPMPEPKRQNYPLMSEWILVVLISLGVSALILGLGLRWTTPHWSLRWCLLAFSGGIIAYLYMAIGLPGSGEWIEAMGSRGIIEISLLGIGLGWAIGVGWELFTRFSQNSRRNLG